MKWYNMQLQIKYSNGLIKYAITNDIVVKKKINNNFNNSIWIAITNDVIKYSIVNDVIKYTITN